MADSSNHKTCVVIGASHAGANFAFALRQEGWQGDILLFDTDPMLPYHRPPLSKTYLTSEDGFEKNMLKPAGSYEKEGITLHPGTTVQAILRKEKTIALGDGSRQAYDKLVLATGARPIIPPIPGIESAKNCFPMRTAEDAMRIRNAIRTSGQKRVVVIGGGYIGLETAASLRKLGAEVTVLEREERILARVTAPEMSAFFQKLHGAQGVQIFTNQNVASIETTGGLNEVLCTDGTRYMADIIVVGAGIRVNTELAAAAGLAVENGIRVDATARTNDPDIYAIGDCTFHFSPHYNRFIRLESVQNAVDQAKVAAAAVCGKEVKYDTIPWFWSDQYDVKLQMAGLSAGYNQVLVRIEEGKENCLSAWYFKDDTLLAVDAVNNARAYVLGTKFIKEGQTVDKSKLVDPSVEFKPANLLRKA
ncbi:MAG: FAD-dependent oxidoreductase [Lewinellaceae bacterium]|nr:FAD-dependent oxidoreductase [Saprospiraceae bacterium]MCB9336776.1 FAD-dependent oxidoreductase [Lewinellaceae bacterium]